MNFAHPVRLYMLLTNNPLYLPLNSIEFFTLVTESFSKYSECKQLHKDETRTIEEKFNDNSFCDEHQKRVCDLCPVY